MRDAQNAFQKLDEQMRALAQDIDWGDRKPYFGDLEMAWGTGKPRDQAAYAARREAIKGFIVEIKKDEPSDDVLRETFEGWTLLIGKSHERSAGGLDGMLAAQTHANEELKALADLAPLSLVQALSQEGARESVQSVQSLSV